MDREQATLTLLLISGSLRSGSINEAVLKTVQATAPDGLVAHLLAFNGRVAALQP